MNQRTKRNTGEKGQSLVELALGLTTMLIILAGTVDMGRILFYYLSLRNAAQEGATYGSIYPNFCQQIHDRAFFTLEDPDVQVSVIVDGLPCNPSDTGSLTVPPVHACYPHTLEVIAENPKFPLTMPFIGAFLGRQTIDLKVNISETIVRPSCTIP